MTELATATIIPFPPSRSRGAETAAAPVPPDERLTRALAGLNDAVNAQRAAIATWRAALGDLQAMTGRLGASLRGYHDSLGDLSTRVSTLHGEAEKLEAWADRVIAQEG